MLDLKKIPVINNEQIEPRKSPLDVQNATDQDVINLFTIDRQTHDSFKDINIWQGVIVRVIDEQKNFEYSQRTEILNQEITVGTTKKYKVCLLNGPGKIIDLPKTYDSPEDQRLIDTLDDYSLSPKITYPLNLGDIVFISKQNYKDRVIEYTNNKLPVAPLPSGQTPPPPPSGQFSGPPSPRGPISSPPDETLIKKGVLIKPRIKVEKCNNDPKKYEEAINQFSVDVNPRYAKDGNTYCNIFGWDVAVAMSLTNYPHFISVKDQKLNGKDLKKNQPVNNEGYLEFIPKKDGSTVVELNGNATYDWFNNPSNLQNFGWKLLSGPKEAQETANKGNFVVGAVKRQNKIVKDKNGRQVLKKGIGHIIVVYPDPNNEYNETKGILLSHASGVSENKVYCSRGMLGELTNYIFATPDKSKIGC